MCAWNVGALRLAIRCGAVRVVDLVREHPDALSALCGDQRHWEACLIDCGARLDRHAVHIFADLASDLYHPQRSLPWSCLQNAVRHNNLSVVAAFIAHPRSPAVGDPRTAPAAQECIIAAVGRRRPPVDAQTLLDTLFAFGIQPSPDAVRVAVRFASPDVVRRLVTAGANVGLSSEDMCLIAISHGRGDMLDTIRECVGDIDRSNPLFAATAAEMGHWNVLGRLRNEWGCAWDHRVVQFALMDVHPHRQPRSTMNEGRMGLGGGVDGWPVVSQMRSAVGCVPATTTTASQRGPLSAAVRCSPAVTEVTQRCGGASRPSWQQTADRSHKSTQQHPSDCPNLSTHTHPPPILTPSLPPPSLYIIVSRVDPAADARPESE